MPILTLRPNSDVSVQMTRSTGSYNYGNVDESIADDGDYNCYLSPVTADSVTLIDKLGLPNHSSQAGTINSVTVYIRHKWISYTGGASIYIGVNDNYGSNITPTSSWVTSSRAMTTNPGTSVAWTWQNIDDMVIDIKTIVNGDGKYGSNVGYSWAYVEVDYNYTTYNLSVADSVNCSDTASVLKKIYPSVSDDAKASETLAVYKQLHLSVTDVAKNSESLSAQKIIYPVATDGTKAGDAAVFNRSFVLMVSDCVNAGDLVALQKAYNLAVSDIAKVADIVANQCIINPVASDGAVNTDTPAIHRTICFIVTDAAKASEVLANSMAINLSVSDTAVQGDTVASKMAFFMTVTDAIKTTDLALIQGKPVRFIVIDSSCLYAIVFEEGRDNEIESEPGCTVIFERTV